MRLKFNVAVVGATGLVGRTMLKVLESRNFPVDKLSLFASERSAGTILKFKEEDVTVQAINEKSFKNTDIALFSAGKEVSVKYAPIAAKSGCIVIDNGSYWRMDERVPLIVPEVNPESLKNHKGIIANPNCSTIQLVVALKPIQDKFQLKRVVVSTYQSISGAGQKGVDRLIKEIWGTVKEEDKQNKHKIAYNTLFHEITDNSGFSIEEIKMKNEIRKIMILPDLPIAVTCVRLPVLGGHGESVNIETEKDFTVEAIRDLFNNRSDIALIDNPKDEDYPTVHTSRDTDIVYVGRIRKDDSVKYGGYLWVVADNLRKGAATNAVQIAELLVEKQLFEYDKNIF